MKVKVLKVYRFNDGKGTVTCRPGEIVDIPDRFSAGAKAAGFVEVFGEGFETKAPEKAPEPREEPSEGETEAPEVEAVALEQKAPTTKKSKRKGKATK